MEDQLLLAWHELFPGRFFKRLRYLHRTSQAALSERITELRTFNVLGTDGRIQASVLGYAVPFTLLNRTSPLPIFFSVTLVACPLMEIPPLGPLGKPKPLLTHRKPSFQLIHSQFVTHMLPGHLA